MRINEREIERESAEKKNDVNRRGLRNIRGLFLRVLSNGRNVPRNEAHFSFGAN